MYTTRTALALHSRSTHGAHACDAADPHRTANIGHVPEGRVGAQRQVGPAEVCIFDRERYDKNLGCVMRACPRLESLERAAAPSPPEP